MNRVRSRHFVVAPKFMSSEPNPDPILRTLESSETLELPEPFPVCKKKIRPRLDLAERFSHSILLLPSFGIIWTQKIDKGIANVAAVVHVHPVGSWDLLSRVDSMLPGIGSVSRIFFPSS